MKFDSLQLFLLYRFGFVCFLRKNGLNIFFCYSKFLFVGNEDDLGVFPIIEIKNIIDIRCFTTAYWKDQNKKQRGNSYYPNVFLRVVLVSPL